MMINSYPTLSLPQSFPAMHHNRSIVFEFRYTLHMSHILPSRSFSVSIRNIFVTKSLDTTLE